MRAEWRVGNTRVDVAAMIAEAPSDDGQPAGNPVDHVNDTVSFHNLFIFLKLPF